MASIINLSAAITYNPSSTHPPSRRLAAQEHRAGKKRHGKAMPIVAIVRALYQYVLADSVLQVPLSLPPP